MGPVACTFFSWRLSGKKKTKDRCILVLEERKGNTIHALIDLLNEEVERLDFDFACTGFSNIMPRGYNKGSGVRALCEALRITVDDVVVFGDAGNDLAMFSVVPDSVAVANAQQAAADAARWHIGQCKDDAVAAAIESLASGAWPFS